MLPFSDNRKTDLSIKNHAVLRVQAGQPLRFWTLLILGCLMAGLLLRWVDLGEKIYWYDEAFTFLRISGHTEAEAVQALDSQKPEGQKIFDSAALQPYQQVNSNKGIGDTIHGLAIEEPQHTPLYYALVRLWAEAFGSSVSAVRSFSVVASVLALPCMAWLCWELFQSAFAAGLGAAILAVSPFQMVYAQEARPTALWTTTILLASAALLRAMRTKERADWMLYGITLTTSFYGYLFSGFIAIIHTIYVLLVERLRLTPKLLFFGAALGASVLLFAPWLLILATNSAQVNTVTEWVTANDQYTFVSLIRQWAYHVILPFVDRGEITLPPALYWLDYGTRWCVRLLILYSLYRLWRWEPLRVWLFVFLLTGVPAIMLTLPDVLYGGKRSTIPRYLVPVYLGLELAVIYGLSQQWSQFKELHRWRRLAWQGLTVLILGAGLATSALIVQNDVWWNKSHSTNVKRLAQIVNQAERPLLISDTEMADLFALNHYLDPKVRLLLRPQCYACQVSDRSLLDSPYLPPIPSGFSDVFLYNPRPSDLWLSRLKQAPYSIKTLSEGFNNWFWKIEQQ